MIYINKAVLFKVSNLSKAFSFYLSSSKLENKEFQSGFSKFDQEVKESYLNKNRGKLFSKLNLDEIKKKITEDFEQAQQDVSTKESVLKDLKNQALSFKQPRLKTNARDKEYTAQINSHSNVELRKFGERYRNNCSLKSDVDLFQTDKISYDYGNYDQQEGNSISVKSQEVHRDQETHYDKTSDRLIDFFDALDPDVYQRQTLGGYCDLIMNNNKDIKTREQALERIKAYHYGLQMISQENYQSLYLEQPDAYQFRNYKVVDTYDEKVQDDIAYRGRLSPMARDEIFYLYLKGWSIKDIVDRYGILPSRAKAVIYMRQKFYTEVFPKTSLQTLSLIMEREQENLRDHAIFVDYGLDLDELQREQRGIQKINFAKSKNVDVKKLEQLDERQKKLMSETRKKKYDLVIERLMGEGHKGLYLKSWVVYRGKGSQRVSKRFKEILQYSSRQDKLPAKIQNKLSEGPRIASIV